MANNYAQQIEEKKAATKFEADYYHTRAPVPLKRTMNTGINTPAEPAQTPGREASLEFAGNAAKMIQ